MIDFPLMGVKRYTQRSTLNRRTSVMKKYWCLLLLLWQLCRVLLDKGIWFLARSTEEVRHDVKVNKPSVQQMWGRKVATLVELLWRNNVKLTISWKIALRHAGIPVYSISTKHKSFDSLLLTFCLSLTMRSDSSPTTFGKEYSQHKNWFSGNGPTILYTQKCMGTG